MGTGVAFKLVFLPCEGADSLKACSPRVVSGVIAVAPPVATDPMLIAGAVMETPEGDAPRLVAVLVCDTGGVVATVYVSPVSLRQPVSFLLSTLMPLRATTDRLSFRLPRKIIFRE